jgi:hypothetical protein
MILSMSSVVSAPIRPVTCSHAIPAMQEEAAALIAGLVFAREKAP